MRTHPVCRAVALSARRNNAASGPRSPERILNFAHPHPSRGPRRAAIFGVPTIACAPSATWTCWTIIFCSPFERYSFKADTCAANVLASLLKAVWALSYMRESLALDIRRLVTIMLQTHELFGRASSENKPLRADAVVKEISRGAPVVFPAIAGRVGLLGFPVAGYVLMFHANLKQIEHQGGMAANSAGYVPPADLRDLVKLIEDACR